MAGDDRAQLLPVRLGVRPGARLVVAAQVRVRDLEAEDGTWTYTEPDWEKLMAVVSGNGPASAERIAFRRLSRAEIDWVSRTVLAEAA